MVGWSDVLTGSTALIANFLDDLIDIGYTGRNRALLAARNRARQYLRDTLLPRWLDNDTWGRSYWDWDNPTICGTLFMICDYFQRARADFPNWRSDLRNLMLLIANRNSADPVSVADTYSGAWAWPESSVCCGTSLSYNQYTAAPTIIRYAALAQDPWASEIGRRMILMATYDSDARGVVKDGIFGEAVATGEWSNLAHPWPLCQVLEAMAWMPGELAPNRDSHLLRSSSVVSEIAYETGRIAWRTFDAPRESTAVLRLAFAPARVTADGNRLRRRTALTGNGYRVDPLDNGDCLVTLRHDGHRRIIVEGDDPQESVGTDRMQFTGDWTAAGSTRSSSAAGDTMTLDFHGHRVRLLGSVGPDGGWADAFLDGEPVLTRIECWNPEARSRQPLFARAGLRNGPHQLRIVVRGDRNPIASNTRIGVEGAQFSAATGDAGFGSGGGPTGPQRMIFGYPGREDYVDSHGQSWRPATEFIIRLGSGQDTVARSWWTSRRTKWIGNTPDPELYRYGVHGKEFKVNLTAGPGRYRLTLKWADTAETPWLERENGWNRVTRPTAVWVNGQPVVDRMDIAKEAGGLFRAVDRNFGAIEPRNGIVEVRFKGLDGKEAMIQALELVPE